VPAPALLHFHRMRRQQFANAPELLHFFGLPEGNANIFLHLRDARSDKNVVIFEVFDNLSRGKTSFHQDKVRVRINRTQHEPIGPVVELLPIVCIPLRTEPNMVGIVKGSFGSPCGNWADTPLQLT
jgi:hypothetical protein